MGELKQKSTIKYNKTNYVNMIREFLIGVVQGALIGMLIGAFNVGFFGKIVLVIEKAFFGDLPLLGIIIPALLNILFYYLFSRKSIKENLIVFVLGFVVGIILL